MPPWIARTILLLLSVHRFQLSCALRRVRFDACHFTPFDDWFWPRVWRFAHLACAVATSRTLALHPYWTRLAKGSLMQSSLSLPRLSISFQRCRTRSGPAWWKRTLPYPRAGSSSPSPWIPIWTSTFVVPIFAVPRDLLAQLVVLVSLGTLFGLPADGHQFRKVVWHLLCLVFFFGIADVERACLSGLSPLHPWCWC